MDSKDGDLDDDIINAFNDSHEWAETTLHASQEMDIEILQSTQKLIETSMAVADDPEPEHYAALRQYFGHTVFKPLQWKIIRSILMHNRDNCAVMATGYGKSLCYQFPPVFTGGIALVISPLISLMQDQVLALTVANIPACYLGSANNKKDQTLREIFDRKYNLVYLTPELCNTDYGQDLLKDMNNKLDIMLIAIDEAHCVSTWGNDFRHDYRKLGVLKTIFENTPTLALTATATQQVRRDIVTSLKLNNPQILCSGFDRPNLYFSASLKEKNSVITQLIPFMSFVNGKYTFVGPTIIYCITKKETDTFASILKSEQIDCAVYHAGISIQQRKEIHEKFVKDKVNCIVATIAFGMGIDKPDVRTVIHWGASSCLESYYQEVGRAGRDGQPAKVHAFFNNADYAIHRFLREKTNLSDKIKKVKENNIKKMRDYLDTINCRRNFILNHFQETLEVGKVTPNCCDNCTKRLTSSESLYEGVNEEGKFNFTDDAFTFLNAVDAINGRFGLEKIVLFLKGSTNSKILAYQNSASFGSGRSKSDAWWRAMSRILEKESFIQQVKNDKTQFTFFTIQCTKYGLKYVNNYKEDKNECEMMLVPIPEMIPLLKKKSNPNATSHLNSFNSQPTTSRVNSVKQKEKPAETPEEVLSLYRKLLDIRNEIANDLDIMPYVIASNEALMKMAQSAPRNIRAFREASLPGFTEAKIEKFSQKFMDLIISIKGPEVVKPISDYNSLFNILRQHPFTKEAFGTSAMNSYECFKNGMSVTKIGETRGLARGTIVSHLLGAMKVGLPVKMNELGVTDEILRTILKVIRAPPLNNSTMLLTPIKNLCPESITFNDIKIVVTYIQLREHLKALAIPYSDFEEFSYESLDDLVEVESAVKTDGAIENFKEERNDKYFSQSSALDYLIELADADDNNVASENTEVEKAEDSDATIIDEDVMNSFLEDSIELPSKKICLGDQPPPKKKCNEIINFEEMFSAINTP